MRRFFLWAFDTCVMLPLFFGGLFLGCLWGAFRSGFGVGVVRVCGDEELPWQSQPDDHEDADACEVTGSAVG